ncbi:MAG TPA: ATP synthase F1 subunit delta [Epulopiscium sp.]|nr:ATP synthase F1 subunit delta [Candidatus Epulonipiscium sp.]
MAKLVLRPYATALFEIAQEQNATEEFAKQVNVVIESIEQNSEFMELLLHPKITQSEKIQLIDTVFKDKVADEITGILTIIVRKGRQNVLIDILKEFLAMVSDYLGIIKVTVTSAVELNHNQLAQIKEKIQSTTNKEIELNAIIDSSLIGGMVIRVGDNVVDASIAGRLRELKEGLTNLRLA